MEVGKRTYSSSTDDQNTAKLSYNYVFGADTDVPTIIDMDAQPYRYKTITPHERYRLVERENKNRDPGFTGGSPSNVYRIVSTDSMMSLSG